MNTLVNWQIDAAFTCRKSGKTDIALGSH